MSFPVGALHLSEGLQRRKPPPQNDREYFDGEKQPAYSMADLTHSIVPG
jgi:hypothetical protein